MTFLLIAALNLQIDLGTLIHRASPAPPSATCHIATVSYRFVGEPGTEFKYDGDNWRLPATGSIELIAAKNVTEYQIAGSPRPLEVWPRDAFGTRTVPLPRNH